MAEPESSETSRTRSFEGNLLNSRRYEPDGSSDTDICAAGVGHVLNGLAADALDVSEAAACTHRRLELEAARTELELRREATRALELQHKLWRQNGTVVFVAVLMGAIAIRSDLSSPALFVLLMLSGLITKAVFDRPHRPAEQVTIQSPGGLR